MHIASTSFNIISRSLLVFSTLLIALLGCSRTSTPVIKTPTAAQVAEFTNNARITFPSSALPIGWREERGMDDALWLQVRMPAQDLPGFLDGSPFRSTNLTTNDQYGVFDFGDFLRTPPMRYRSGEQVLPNARVLKMLIDESDTTNVVVYLMWHET